MASGVSFEIQGLPGFRAALERAVDEVRANVGKAMEESAYAIRDDAVAHIEGAHTEAGDLRRAIIVEGRKLSWRVGIAETVVSSRGGDRVHQRPFIYGAILERGSKKQGARAFMRPAADKEESRFQQRVNRAGLVY